MSKRFLVPVLALALLVSLGWGLSQNQARRQWEINAENQYRRAFQQLTGNMNNMENLMSKAMVAGSFPQSVTLLTNIWREANSCQENLGQLPLSAMELARTKLLLANASAFCFNAAQNKLLKGTRFNPKEWTSLKALRDQTRIATKHLLGLQQSFFTARVRWLDVDRIGAVGASGLAGALHDNKVTKAFLMLEDGLRRVPDLSLVGNNLDFTPKPTGLTGSNISSTEAVSVCRNYVGPGAKGMDVRYERMIKGSIPSYLITINDRANPGRNRQCSVSVKGGHVLWMLSNRDVGSSKLSLAQGQAKALAFLNQKDYPGMKCVAREESLNIGNYTCAAVRNQVVYYPEMVKVQVALDNGEVMSTDATAFLTFNDPNVSPVVQASIPKSQILRLLNPQFKQSSIELAQVLDEMFNKVLCYEVSGTQGQDKFLIYYNATTGKEEKIRRVDTNGNELL